MKGWVDPLTIRDRCNHDTDSLRDLLAGRDAFIAAGGPSTKSLPLSELTKRGCFVMAVNNMAGHKDLRPQSFVCSDPPSKFHTSIWLDPGIMKFIPTPKLNGGNHRSGIKQKNADGSFTWIQKEKKQRLRVKMCPNVWGFERRSWMAIDETWFTENSAAWGNHNAGVEKTGELKTVCTLLLAMRLMRYLGAKNVFLVGVDFYMTPDQGYSFEQTRDQGACDSNNKQFTVVNDWICRLEKNGIFKKYGINFFNCNPNSGLRAFPHVPFLDAVAKATENIDNIPDLEGWYEKK